MPRSADDRSELFAQALEAGASRPATDHELRRELDVVQMLVHAGSAAGPDEAARQRMRNRVMAGFDAAFSGDSRAGSRAEPSTDAPAAVPESAPAPTVDLEKRRQRRASRARRHAGPHSMHGRLLGAAAAALCLLLSLSGMSLILARDALPGDALYGVKRSAESAELGLTFGDESRGFKHLQFATARVDEIEALAAQAGGTGATPEADPGRYLTALQAFDIDSSAGSRLLIDSATNGTGEQLEALGGWAAQQRQRLADAKPAMPSRAASRADGSITLLDRVSERVAALQQRLSCQTVTAQERDDLGSLPAQGQCVPVTTGPRASSQQAPQGESGAPTQPSPAGLVIPGQAPAAGEPGASGGAAGVPNPLGPLGSLNPLDPQLTAPTVPPPGGEPPPEGQRSGGATGSGSETLPLPVPLDTVTTLLPPIPGVG